MIEQFPSPFENLEKTELFPDSGDSSRRINLLPLTSISHGPSEKFLAVLRVSPELVEGPCARSHRDCVIFGLKISPHRLQRQKLFLQKIKEITGSSIGNISKLALKIKRSDDEIMIKNPVESTQRPDCNWLGVRVDSFSRLKLKTVGKVFFKIGIGKLPRKRQLPSFHYQLDPGLSQESVGKLK